MLFVKSEEINAIFDQEIAQLTGGQINMPGIMEAVRLIYREEAIEEGLKEGLQKGIAQGIEQGIEQGLEQGIERGMERGRHEEALDIAREMKKDRFPIEKIAKLTKLPIAEIQAL